VSDKAGALASQVLSLEVYVHSFDGKQVAWLVGGLFGWVSALPQLPGEREMRVGFLQMR